MDTRNPQLARCRCGNLVPVGRQCVTCTAADMKRHQSPPSDFIEKVAAMRDMQRKWFNKATRTQEVMREAMRLEREVDRELERLLDPQPTLFPEN